MAKIFLAGVVKNITLKFKPGTGDTPDMDILEFKVEIPAAHSAGEFTALSDKFTKLSALTESPDVLHLAIATKQLDLFDTLDGAQ